MKFTTVIVSALATLAAAAPAPTEKAVEARAVSFDVNQFNSFGSQNFAYFGNINNFDFGLLQQLALQQNLDILKFQGLFQQNANFDVANLVAFGQLHTLVQLGKVGLFNGFDLGGLALGGLNLGVGGFNFGVLQNGVGDLGLGNFIQGNQLNQIQAITSSLILA